MRLGAGRERKEDEVDHGVGSRFSPRSATGWSRDSPWPRCATAPRLAGTRPRRFSPAWQIDDGSHRPAPLVIELVDDTRTTPGGALRDVASRRRPDRRAHRAGRHDLALVLGSGLGGYAAALTGIEIPYERDPGDARAGVEGHGGVLVSAMADGYPVLAFTGRVHAYEGWDLAEVVFGVRTAVLAGCCRTVVLTNAAGGVGDGLSRRPGRDT